ncbi:hypothetical protein DYB35_011244 [Aphanomyces astaci]|uniref:RxLR effector protein n=1 Tax=Aphanomyces astaci TaxID=112090 RepID=A0A418CVV5_APHAT|nr:hypothetical protein DYB35_011244 [Aphanomyces astaci]
MKLFVALTTMAAVASAASFRVASVPVDRHLTAEQQYRAEKYVGLLYRGAAQEQGPTRRLKEEGVVAAPEVEYRHLEAQQDKESEVRGATRPQRRLSFHDAAASVDRHLAAEQRFQELKHVGILSRGAAQEEGPTHSLTDFLFVPVLPSAHIQNEEGDIRAGQKPTGGFFELPDERRLTGQQQHSGQELWGVELDSVGDNLIVPVLPTSMGAGEANAFHPRAVAKAKALGGARSIGIQQVGHMSPSD